MRVFVFPGQGSQWAGMGDALFQAFPDYVHKTDEVLGYSIEELCLRDPERKLDQTLFTQPAIYVVGVLSYLRRVEQKGDYPDLVLGHSVGEYCALFAAAAFDYETGLRLVQRRAQLMSEARGGAMAAVIGCSEDDVRRILDKARLHDLDIANVNSHQQVVVAGPRGSIEGAKAAFDEARARYVVLKVSGAFHSRYMSDASAAFASFLAEQSPSDPRYPIVSNVDARPYEDGQIQRRLSDQIKRPVRWVDSIRYLEGLGATTFEEIGAGNVLKTLIAQIRGDRR